MASETRSTKFRGVGVLVVSLLLNLIILGFAYYSSRFKDELSSCFIIINCIYAFISIISIIVGLFGLIRDNESTLSYHYHNSFTSSFFSLALAAIHFVVGIYLNVTVVEMNLLKTAFHVTGTVYILLFICNVYIAISLRDHLKKIIAEMDEQDLTERAMKIKSVLNKDNALDETNYITNMGANMV